MGAALTSESEGGAYGAAQAGCYGGYTKYGGASKNSEEDYEDIVSLRNYESSIASKTKEDVIRRLARAMKRAGIAVDPEDDLDTIVKSLTEKIPNPKKGKTFSADAKSQEKVCRVIADVLNDEYTPGIKADAEKFIDTSLSAVELCRAVGEWSHSFSVGVNNEFMAVNASVKNALRSIKVLDEVMSQLHKKIKYQIDKARDPVLERELGPLDEMYIRAKHERDRKQMVLENMLHIHLAPASKALEIALKDESEDAALIKRIGLRPGTSEFGDSLASAISSLGTAASIANRVHKALKVVGVTANEYLNSNSFKDFEHKLDSVVENGKVNYKDLVKFLSATKTLREGFGERNNSKFKKILTEGGDDHIEGGYYDNIEGGDDDEEDLMGNPLKSNMHRRGKRVAAQRRIINTDFVIRLNRHYTDLLEVINKMAPELGKTIPLTSKTELLRDALKHLEDHAGSSTGVTMTVEYIVTYNVDTIEAKEIKEKFINKLKMIANISDAIMQLEAYRKSSSYFAKIRDIILDIEKTINFFSKAVQSSISSFSTVGEYKKIESKIQAKMESSSSNDDEDDENKEGGNDDINAPEIAKSGITLNSLINIFQYYYYIAGVRNNLKISALEYSSYGEDYNNLLGNSIAKRINVLELDYNQKLTYLNNYMGLTYVAARSVAGGYNESIGILAPGGGGNRTVNLGGNPETIKTAIKKWIDDEFNIKIKFYKALQALDLYLKEFTSSIVTDIDSIKEIKTMLDETQVIARWYNESTGNYLASAFEQLPINNDYELNRRNNGRFVLKGENLSSLYDYSDPEYTNHYYNAINDNFNANNAAAHNIELGDPKFSQSFFDIFPEEKASTKCENIKKFVNNSVDHFQALKNIVNAFIRIGNKFGSKDLSSKVFMSPSQIYRVLIEYLKQSALRVKIRNTAPVGAPIANIANIAAGDAFGNGQNQTFIENFQLYFTSVGQNFSMENYEVEDKFFHAMIKAMAGKILTAVGSYDMIEMVPPKHWITNTRIILGGETPINFDDNLEIIPEAVPLYFKLPRLIEFYRELFEHDFNSITEKITFLPDLDGVFTQLFLIIFRKSKSPENGDYTDSELHKIVEEVNKIYQVYLKQQNVDITTAIMQDIVLDINRKYGIIKKEDYQTWVNTSKQNVSVQNIHINNTNYSILPDENEYDVEKRAPSDIYYKKEQQYDPTSGRMIDPATGRAVSNFSGLVPDIANITDKTLPHQKLIEDFRFKINSYFESTNIKTTSSYTILVHQTTELIKKAKSNKEKISLTFQLIQGTGSLGLNEDKALLFHETIITGLNVLGGIEIMINRFNEKLDKMNPIQPEKNIMNNLQKLETNKRYSQTNNIRTFDWVNNYSLTGKEYSNIQYNSLINYKFKRYMGILYHSETENNSEKISPEYKYYKEYQYYDEPLFRGSRILPDVCDVNIVNGVDMLNTNSSSCEDLNNKYYTNELLDNFHLTYGSIINLNMDNNATDAYNHDTFMFYYIQETLLIPILLSDFIILDQKKLPETYLGNNIYFTRHFNRLTDNSIFYSIRELNSLISTIDMNKGNYDNMMGSLIPAFNTAGAANIGLKNHNTTESTNNIQKVNDVLHSSEYISQERLLNTYNIEYDDTDHVRQNTPMSIFESNIPSFTDIRGGNIPIRQNNRTRLGNTRHNDRNTIKDIYIWLYKYRFKARALVDYQKIMEHLLENLYSLIIDSNGLIDLSYERIENNQVKFRLSFIKLQNAVNSIISDLKFYLEYFRPFLDSKIVKKYEDIGVPGSIYFIEKKFEILFNTKIDQYNPDISFKDPIMSVENIQSKTNKIYAHLIRDTYVSFNYIGKYGNNNNSVTRAINETILLNIKTNYEWYGNTLSKLIYYDFSNKQPWIYSTNNRYPVDHINRVNTINTNNYPYCEFPSYTDDYTILPDWEQPQNEISNNYNYNIDQMYNIISLVDFTSPNSRTDKFLNPKDYIQYSTNRKMHPPPPGNFLYLVEPHNYFKSSPGGNIHFNNNTYKLYNMEKTNNFSYPKYPSSKTGNYPYNMGIHTDNPIKPSTDINYKLTSLITLKPRDNRSQFVHLIQFPDDYNSDQKEYYKSPLYNNEAVVDSKNSLMFIFNQLLSKYLTSFVDPSTGNKIYKNLINMFSNGVASKVVSSPESGFPDLYKAGYSKLPNQTHIPTQSFDASTPFNTLLYQKALGLRGDVKSESIVFQSLAYILQRVNKDINTNTSINLHLVNTLTDVPIYMKESYKANLPSFIKLFDYIIQKAEFFKNIIEKTSINLSRYSQVDFANFINSCTGITDIRVNEVRYELQNELIPLKFIYGLDLRSITDASEYYQRPTAATQPINGYNHTFDYNLDRILGKLIKFTDNVKISCTRGTHNYMLNYEGIDHSTFLKTNDTYCKQNGYISVNGLEKFTKENEKSDIVKSKFISILDSIISHAYSLSTSSNEVLKELGDDPIYFETFSNSIDQYHDRNNNDQLMPLSLALWFLNDNKSLIQHNEEGPTHTLFPGHNLGTLNFKLLYGIRQLLARNSNITYEQIPGVKTILTRHNTSSSDSAIDIDKYLQYIQKIVMGLRFIVNSHGYKRIIAYNSDGVNFNTNIFDQSDIMYRQFGLGRYKNFNYNEIPNNNIWINSLNIQFLDNSPQNPNKFLLNINKNVVYALKSHEKEKIFQIIEDSYQENSIKKILQSFDSNNQKTETTRKTERIKVIIDSNINPINVHALMQDIPLANIYNYEYTFESMVASMYGTINDCNKITISTNDNSGFLNKEVIYTFLKLLKDPFISIPESDNINTSLEHIFTGDSSLAMGRPKFLSDQLFNKCLLQNIYKDSTISYDVGPNKGVSNNFTNINNLNAANINQECLTYLDNEETVKMVFNYNGHRDRIEIKNLLTHISKSRFDTHIVRNMFFISNILRIIRLQINREFTQNRNILKNSHFAISPTITEYGINSPNEAFNSNFNDASPFNDQIQ